MLSSFAAQESQTSVETKYMRKLVLLLHDTPHIFCCQRVRASTQRKPLILSCSATRIDRHRATVSQLCGSKWTPSWEDASPLDVLFSHSFSSPMQERRPAAIDHARLLRSAALCAVGDLFFICCFFSSVLDRSGRPNPPISPFRELVETLSPIEERGGALQKPCWRPSWRAEANKCTETYLARRIETHCMMTWGFYVSQRLTEIRQDGQKSRYRCDCSHRCHRISLFWRSRAQPMPGQCFGSEIPPCWTLAETTAAALSPLVSNANHRRKVIPFFGVSVLSYTPGNMSFSPYLLWSCNDLVLLYACGAGGSARAELGTEKLMQARQHAVRQGLRPARGSRSMSPYIKTALTLCE